MCFYFKDDSIFNQETCYVFVELLIICVLLLLFIIKYETHQSRCSSTDKREKYRGMAKKEN